MSQISGKPTFINFGQPAPNQLFTAIIWEEHRNKWETEPETLYQNKQVCITGIITEHEGKPQIIVENPRQIEIRY